MLRERSQLVVALHQAERRKLWELFDFSALRRGPTV